MHRIPLSLFAGVACFALAISSAPAAGRLANTQAAPSVASSPQATTSQPGSTSRRHDRALTRAARKARKPSKAKPVAPALARAIVDKRSNRNVAAARKAAQAESDARAERLYRASQFSAPIIIDAKACKRVGANGESIFENC